MLLPVLQKGIKEFPRQLRFIGADEQRRIAEHGVEQQTLISIGAGVEMVAVAEIHRSIGQLEALTGIFARQLQQNGFQEFAGNLLAFRDFRDLDRGAVATRRQIQQGTQGIAGFLGNHAA